VRAAGDVFSCVTSVEHLAARVAEIWGTGSLIRPGGPVENPPHIYNVANDGICSPAEFALEAARLVGADSSLVEVVSDGRHAPPIVTDPPLPHWRQALAEYVESARYD
jgi:dTDP-4-dehydrorhamnose reductase